MPEPWQRHAVTGLGYGPRVAVFLCERVHELVRMVRAEVICEVVARPLEGYGHELVVGYAYVFTADAARFDSVPVAFAPAPLTVFVLMVALEKLFLYVFNRHPSPHAYASLRHRFLPLLK